MSTMLDSDKIDEHGDEGLIISLSSCAVLEASHCVMRVLLIIKSTKE